VYIPTGTNDLVAVNAATGEVRWRFRGEGDQALPMSPAALVGDSLYVVDSNYVYALAEA
jgi:outer membrane protein assembly factor BamB